MTPSERLKLARRQAGWETAAEAALTFGWTPTTYFGHENGSRNFSAAKAAIYAKAFKVSPEWLLFGKPMPADILAALSKPDDNELVPVFSVTASAGYGALVDGEEIVDRLAFPAGYLRRITSANPRDLAIIGVKGKSMEPTLSDDDLVMVDTSKRDLSFDGLFVLRDGGASLLVKRIGRGRRRGTVMLISDNPTFHPVEREIEEIEVVGKVVWKGVKE